jgi:phospholipid/cholesterol/gamma-HCH transport system permease protein
MANSADDPAFDDLLDVSRGPTAAAFAALKGFTDEVRALAAIFRRTLHYTFRGAPAHAAIAKELYEIGNRSALFLSVTMGFMGMIFVYQAGLQIRRVIPDLSQLGATFLELLVRDLAASISALMLATRVGAGIAAEIGSMVVTEQVDALRMCAADPVDYLVRPRFVASVVMTTALTLLGGAVAFGTGTWTASTFFGLNPRTFVDASLVDTGDLVIGFSKCLAYGAAIPVISAHAGLTTRGGSEGVGSAATRAVVNSSLAVIMLNFVISTLGYIAFG